MKVIPAVDILEGECVQLVGGDPKTKKTYGDPVDIAVEWINQGARMLHIVDLDAALGTGENYDKIKVIRSKTSATMIVGGGVRDEDKIDDLMHLSVDKIILGTAAINDIEKDFDFLSGIRKMYGHEKFIVAVDSRKGKVVTKGWQEKTSIKTVDAMKALEPYCGGFLFTDVDVEGQMKGSRMKRIQEVLDATSLPVIASGGIRSKKEIDELKAAGAWGVIVGKALYEKKIPVEVLGEYR
ncbi:MAG: 1-(5-phosphoribosyl)-5-[(5-phosphoribosylamino)methylideneamino]imidazole-4-carboxamide isomerase [Candidatus Altiarchaeota archaeon]